MKRDERFSLCPHGSFSYYFFGHFFVPSIKVLRLTIETGPISTTIAQLKMTNNEGSKERLSSVDSKEISNSTEKIIHEEQESLLFLEIQTG